MHHLKGSHSILIIFLINVLPASGFNPDRYYAPPIFSVLEKPVNVVWLPEVYFPSPVMSDAFQAKAIVPGIRIDKRDRLKDRKTFKWHRIIGYYLLAGSITNVILGSQVLSKYKENEIPSRGVLYAHRTIGVTTGLLGIFNGYLGSVNFKKLQNEKVGLKKRKTHRLLSSLASVGYLATLVLGVKSYLEYKNTENPEDVELANIHRSVALATTGFTIATVVVIIW